jgi:glutamyl-tRNA reductase
MRKRTDPLVFIDVAVPRDVDPAVDRLQNVFRFDMDALDGIVNQNIERRRADTPVVERLVDAETRRFMQWWDSLGTGPVIRDLNKLFDSIRSQEVERNARRFVPEDREQLETFTRTLTRKLLMGVTMEIKHYKTDNPVQVERLAALRELFHLDGEDEGE